MQAEVPQPGAARQNMWSQVLEGGKPVQQQEKGHDTFIQLEPSEAMTKAFTPQGLLSAGLQDKQDRSAKRQEELARETGASLINVPNKPPPPQTGLLGAITAHERERKRDGGVGAALTERERERRLAEDRQRKFDEQQRQQLEQIQQTNSMYGGQFGGFNPMMNPMMMGMNPMMGMAPMMSGMQPMMSGQMGYPGLMPNMTGFNPQHMYAAQAAAAQAYQQAMIALSVAGSQVGGDSGNGIGTPVGGSGSITPVGVNQAAGINPMTMNMGMMGFDPRMSMIGIPMMGMPGMGGGMGTPGMGGPLGMQTTGVSTFDPRLGPGGIGLNDLQPPNAAFAQSGSGSGRSSPAGRGSPLARSLGDTLTAGESLSKNVPPKP